MATRRRRATSRTNRSGRCDLDGRGSARPVPAADVAHRRRLPARRSKPRSCSAASLLRSRRSASAPACHPSPSYSAATLRFGQAKSSLRSLFWRRRPCCRTGLGSPPSIITRRHPALHRRLGPHRRAEGVHAPSRCRWRPCCGEHGTSQTHRSAAPRTERGIEHGECPRTAKRASHHDRPGRRRRRPETMIIGDRGGARSDPRRAAVGVRLDSAHASRCWPRCRSRRRGRRSQWQIATTSPHAKSRPLSLVAGIRQHCGCRHRQMRSTAVHSSKVSKVPPTHNRQNLPGRGHPTPLVEKCNKLPAFILGIVQGGRVAEKVHPIITTGAASAPRNADPAACRCTDGTHAREKEGRARARRAGELPRRRRSVDGGCAVAASPVR